MMLARRNAVAVTLLVAGCAILGPNAEECGSVLGSRGEVDPPFDLGGGVIAAEGSVGFREGGGSSFLNITDCATNGFVQIDRESPNYAAFFEALTDRTEDQSFDWIVDETLSRDLLASARIIFEGGNSETCGCRAFYPQLRGNKREYGANDDWT